MSSNNAPGGGQDQPGPVHSTPPAVTVKAAEPSQSERHQHEPTSQRPIDPGHPDHPMNKGGAA